MNKGKGYLCGVPDIAQFVALRKYNNGAKLHGEKQFQQMCKKGKIYTDDCFTYYPYRKIIVAKVKKVMDIIRVNRTLNFIEIRSRKNCM